MKRLLWIVPFCWLAGCNAPPDRQSYLTYINDPSNKITQAIAVSDVQVNMQFQPETYRKIVEREPHADPANNGDDSLYYFKVRFDKLKGERPDKEKLLYLDFDMQKDFVLAAGADSLLPVFCQKIENGVGGSYEYMVVFDKPVGEDDFSVVYNDKIFGIGSVAFVYKNEDLRKIPVIKHNEQE
jgi:hypothetical protein